MSNRRFRIWEDIATILRAEIARGQWQPDEVLPPQKELARRFGVQTETIGKALQQLTAKGLLYAPHGLRERRVAAARAKSHRTGDFLHDPAWTNPRLETAYLKVEVQPDAIHTLILGHRMIPAMAQWLVPIRVIDCCNPPPVARAVFRDIPISGGFDSNTVAQIGEECLGYVVVYNGQRQQERIWWTCPRIRPHCAGPLDPRMARGSSPRTGPDVFAVEQLLPLEALQAV